jgi:hypothetical protein
MRFEAPSRHSKSLFIAFGFCLALLASIGTSALSAQVLSDSSSVEALVNQIPLVFEPNRGQVSGDVRFLSRGSTYAVLLSPDKTVLVLYPNPVSGDPGKLPQPSTVTLELAESNRQVSPEGLDALPGKSNYFIGKEPAKWIAGIPQYGRVEFKSIYAGIDLVYYGKDGKLEYDFVLSPGADPRTLRFRVKGAKTIELSGEGNLSLEASDGTIELRKPVIYQEVKGVRQTIAGDFALRSDDEIGFNVGTYDVSKPLVIDPVLSYSTLIGANNSTQVQGIAVDRSGNAYITGTTFATNYPTVHAFQSTNRGTSNVFVTKLNPSGNVILYSTYIGSSGSDNAAGIAIDGSGSAYITGTVGGSDFPTTPGAFMTTCPSLGCNTPFISKFLTDGTVAFSTLMGGSNSPAHAIAVDSAGEAYIAGDTASNDLPTTPGSFEPVYPGSQCTSCYNGYVEKLNASGTALVYSTYFGATGLGGVPSTAASGLAVDSAGGAYLVGNTTAIPIQNAIQSSQVGVNLPNAFITKFSPDGSSLTFSTYLGGSSAFFFSYAGDFATGVAVDPSGNVHVVGTSSSCDFPLTLNALNTACVNTSYTQKIFVATLNSSGSQILFSTFLQNGFSSGIAVDKAGNSYVTGTTTSNGFPILNSIESTSQQSSSISFVTELDPGGKLLFSTYLGATAGGSQAAGIAVDGKGAIYVAGAGQGDFPLLHPIPSQVIQKTYYTLFLSKISPQSTPQFSLSPRVSPVLALRNVSSVPLTISAITHSSNFTEGGNCGATLAAGMGCTLILEGADDKKTSGTVTITSNAYTKPQTFTISKSATGDSVGSILTIFPIYVQFPAQLIGTTSTAQQVVIQNSGLSAAAINSITMIQPSVFNETNNCPALLNPASSCTIAVTYSAATSQDSAQLAIVTDPNQTRYTAFLSGFGSTSSIIASTSSVEFGSQFVGSLPLGRMVNLTNTTLYPATVTGLSASTGFAQTNSCSAALAPQASCRVLVTYSPGTNETATGTLVASSLGPGGSQTVNLYATGLIVSDLAASPMPLNVYGYVGEPAGSGFVTLTNTSKVSMTLTSFTVATPFTQSNNCNGQLAAGASCTLTVNFAPSAAGTFNGSVSIQHTGQGSPQIVPLVGTGQTVFAVTPSLLDWGQQRLNTSVIGYLSLGNYANYGNVTVTSITVQGSDFSLSKNGCPSVFPPFTGCGDLEIAFAPKAMGLRTGTVSVVASDSSSPHVANIQGTGISNGQGTLSVASLAFAPQAVGTTSKSQTVTLNNTGTGTLTLGSIVASTQFTQTNTCKTTLAVGASCTISVRFAPTLQGLLVGSLTVPDNGSGSPHVVALTGTGQ